MAKQIPVGVGGKRRIPFRSTDYLFMYEYFTTSLTKVVPSGKVQRFI
jgi:hypothetical protein